jgi:UPF0755 protein
LSVFVFLLLILAGGVGFAAWLVFSPSGPATETFVEVAPGSSTAQIATQLEQAGVIRSRYAFELIRLWKRGSLKAGEYRFERPARADEVYAKIARGDIFTIAVTVPEGANRFDIASRIEQAGLLSGPSAQGDARQQFLAATVDEVRLIADLDPHAATLEGFLFPATYRFARKATAAQMVTAMVRRFRAAATQIGLISPGITSPGQNGNVHQIVTLASLVERETAVESERPLVASVLANRLAKKMPLMTDPAVIYGLESAGQWRGTIYASDLKRDTAYNTYLHAGLPPSPIANPGLRSLEAALHPARTEYLYFVAAGADPQGKSRFAATLDEHNRNVASYRAARKQAGAR